MNLGPTPHPHTLDYVTFPKELTLYFSGDSICDYPCWAWAIMDATTLYASDRGHEESKVVRSNIWCATVGLGKGCAFLHERKWKGKLAVKSHLRDCGIFKSVRASEVGRMVKRCWELLTGVKWETAVITGDENEFCRSLVQQAWKEIGQ